MRSGGVDVCKQIDSHEVVGYVQVQIADDGFGNIALRNRLRFDSRGESRPCKCHGYPRKCVENLSVLFDEGHLSAVGVGVVADDDEQRVGCV